jgi:cardiolipin synthase A/B
MHSFVLMRGRAAWVAAGIALGACTYPNHPSDPRIFEHVPSHGSGLSLALEQTLGGPLVGGNTVTLVENGRVFDALEEEVLKAQTSLNLSTFIWRPSSVSDRIVKAVLSRTAHGVQCRVMVDPLWSVNFDVIAKVLREGGCDVRKYRPFRENAGPRYLFRNHRRVLVIDGKVGITGGFGIWKSWQGDGLRPEEWRDSNVVITGPVVREMQRAFAENWQEVGGALLPASDFPELEPTGNAPATFVTSDTNPALTDAERMTVLMIAAAQHRLWIANSYFIPSTAIADMLISKAKQGVDVRVLVPGPVHDVPPVRAAQRSTYSRLLENGVRIWEYQPSMMHAKTMLVDDSLAVVGSTNLDPLSLKWLEEASLVFNDAIVAAQMDRSLRRDFERSLEIRWSWWKKRGLLERIAQQLTPLIGIFL